MAIKIAADALAVVVYTTEDGDLNAKVLCSEEELLAVENSEHEEISDQKAILIKGDNLVIEYYT